MKERADNLALMCSDCSDERRREWQKNNPKTIISPRDNVKVAFTDKGHTEHMWVQVTEVRGSRITGILNNDPIVVENVRLGDHVEVHRSEVEDLLPHTIGTVH